MEPNQPTPPEPGQTFNLYLAPPLLSGPNTTQPNQPDTPQDPGAPFPYLRALLFHQTHKPAASSSSQNMEPDTRPPTPAPASPTTQERPGLLGPAPILYPNLNQENYPGPPSNPRAEPAKRPRYLGLDIVDPETHLPTEEDKPALLRPWPLKRSYRPSPLTSNNTRPPSPGSPSPCIPPTPAPGYTPEPLFPGLVSTTPPTDTNAPMRAAPDLTSPPAPSRTTTTQTLRPRAITRPITPKPTPSPTKTPRVLPKASPDPHIINLSDGENSPVIPPTPSRKLHHKRSREDSPENTHPPPRESITHDTNPYPGHKHPRRRPPLIPTSRWNKHKRTHQGCPPAHTSPNKYTRGHQQGPVPPLMRGNPSGRRPNKRKPPHTNSRPNTAPADLCNFNTHTPYIWICLHCGNPKEFHA